MSTITQDALTQLRRLSDSQRLDARDKARENVRKAIGQRPDRAQYEHYAASKYPPAVTGLITLLALGALVAAFIPSAIRLYHIGSNTFGQAIGDAYSMTAVGIATVLLAETGQVVFSLALAVLGNQTTSRRLLYISMAIATAIALVGNVQVALPGHWTNPFAYLEAIAPPLLVLSTAYVLKGQLLHAIETRHANERAYQEALAEWKAATGEPEQHDRWPSAYANALRQALWRANGRGSGAGSTARQELMQQLDGDAWRALVLREMKAENWFSAGDLDAAQHAQNGASQPVTAHTGSNGRVPAVNPQKPQPVTTNGNGANSNG